jgi:protein AATF/BFR2
MDGSDQEPSELDEDYPESDSQSDDEEEREEEDDAQSVPSQGEPEEASEQPMAPPRKPSSVEPEAAEDLPSTLRKSREEDRKKGKAVSQQIVRVVFGRHVMLTPYRPCGRPSLTLEYASKSQ